MITAITTMAWTSGTSGWNIGSPTAEPRPMMIVTSNSDSCATPRFPSTRRRSSVYTKMIVVRSATSTMKSGGASPMNMRTEVERLHLRRLRQRPEMHGHHPHLAEASSWRPTNRRDREPHSRCTASTRPGRCHPQRGGRGPVALRHLGRPRFRLAPASSAPRLASERPWTALARITNSGRILAHQ